MNDAELRDLAVSLRDTAARPDNMVQPSWHDTLILIDGVLRLLDQPADCVACARRRELDRERIRRFRSKASHALPNDPWQHSDASNINELAD